MPERKDLIDRSATIAAGLVQAYSARPDFDFAPYDGDWQVEIARYSVQIAKEIEHAASQKDEG